MFRVCVLDRSVSAGRDHSIVLKKDGSVWATGYNKYGQLGDGSETNRQVFVQVISGGVQVVAAGSFHSMILKEDNSIWATGSNVYGQFGDSSTTSQSTFVRLLPFGDGAGHLTLIYIYIYICIHRMTRNSVNAMNVSRILRYVYFHYIYVYLHNVCSLMILQFQCTQQSWRR